MHNGQKKIYAEEHHHGPGQRGGVESRGKMKSNTISTPHFSNTAELSKMQVIRIMKYIQFIF